MGVSRFEDLLAWQRARELTQAIYRLFTTTAMKQDRALCGQIRRASVSVMSNIAEGFERSRPKEFHQALSISKASCAEVRSLLYVALDAELISPDQYETTATVALSANQLVGALRSSVARRLADDK